MSIAVAKTSHQLARQPNTCAFVPYNTGLPIGGDKHFQAYLAEAAAKKEHREHNANALANAYAQKATTPSETSETDLELSYLFNQASELIMNEDSVFTGASFAEKNILLKKIDNKVTELTKKGNELDKGSRTNVGDWVRWGITGGSYSNNRYNEQIKHLGYMKTLLQGEVLREEFTAKDYAIGLGAMASLTTISAVTTFVTLPLAPFAASQQQNSNRKADFNSNALTPVTPEPFLVTRDQIISTQGNVTSPNFNLTYANISTTTTCDPNSFLCNGDIQNLLGITWPQESVQVLKTYQNGSALVVRIPNAPSTVAEIIALVPRGDLDPKEVQAVLDFANSLCESFRRGTTLTENVVAGFNGSEVNRFTIHFPQHPQLALRIFSSNIPLGTPAFNHLNNTNYASDSLEACKTNTDSSTHCYTFIENDSSCVGQWSIGTGIISAIIGVVVVGGGIKIYRIYTKQRYTGKVVSRTGKGEHKANSENTLTVDMYKRLTSAQRLGLARAGLTTPLSCTLNEDGSIAEKTAAAAASINDPLLPAMKLTEQQAAIVHNSAYEFKQDQV